MFHEIRMSYYKYVRKYFSVKDNTIFFNSHASKDFGGNLYYIARQILSGKYGNFIIYISINDKKNLPINIQLLQRDFPKSKIKLVLEESRKKYYAIATAKYLFTDVQLNMAYVKRPGQVFIETWHGTPLKKIGYSYTEDVAITGGQKKSFILANYNLFPNEYTMNNMLYSYRLQNNLQGNILLNGYPRNAIFFDTESAKKLRHQMHLDDKKVYVYMPTWRGQLSNLNSVNEQIALLQKIEKRLSKDQIFYVKLHRLASEEIDFSKFRQIRQFPQDKETYQFLSVADCLITDYSSVMFDYLCTRKKIILYVYDKADYLKKQGTYMNIDELPFPQVNTVDQMLDEMSKPKAYDDTKAYEKFCSYDNIYATEQLCDKIILKKNTCKEIRPKQNNKPNILLYGGDLDSNLNTQRFIYYLDNVNESKFNYCVTYRNIDYFHNPIRLQAVTDSYDLQSIDYYHGSNLNETVLGKKIKKHLYKKNKLNKLYLNKNKKYLSSSFNNQFCRKHFDKIILFPNTPLDVLELMLFADVKEKVIFIYPETLKDIQYSALINYAKEQNYTIIEISDNIFLPQYVLEI